MTTGHLVTRLNATLHGHVDLDHLQHARREVVTGGQLALLLFVTLAEVFAQLLDLLGDRLELRRRLFVLEPDLQPLIALELAQVGLGDLRTGLELVRATVGDLADQHLLDTIEGVFFHDAQLVVHVLADHRQFSLFDLQRTGVFLDAVAGEHLHVDNRAGHTG